MIYPFDGGKNHIWNVLLIFRLQRDYFIYNTIRSLISCVKNLYTLAFEKVRCTILVLVAWPSNFIDNTQKVKEICLLVLYTVPEKPWVVWWGWQLSLQIVIAKTHMMAPGPNKLCSPTAFQPPRAHTQTHTHQCIMHPLVLVQARWVRIWSMTDHNQKI